MLTASRVLSANPCSVAQWVNCSRLRPVPPPTPSLPTPTAWARKLASGDPLELYYEHGWWEVQYLSRSGSTVRVLAARYGKVSHPKHTWPRRPFTPGRLKLRCMRRTHLASGLAGALARAACGSTLLVGYHAPPTNGPPLSPPSRFPLRRGPSPPSLPRPPPRSSVALGRSQAAPYVVAARRSRRSTLVSSGASQWR